MRLSDTRSSSDSPGPRQGTAGHHRFGAWVTPVLVVILCGIVAALTLQKRALRLEAVQLRQQVNWPYVGLTLPTLHGTTLDGDPVAVGRSERGARQVLFILDTRCGNCLVTLPAWGQIAETLRSRPEAVEVIGISTDPPDETRAYVQEHGLEFALVSFPDERFRQLYKVAGVPITLVVDPEGVVAEVILGSIFKNVEMLTDSIIDAALAISGSRATVLTP